MSDRITPSNVGQKLNDALKISDNERNMILFELGNSYFEQYAGGDEEFRRFLTTGVVGRTLWNWYTHQFYMASAEFLNVLNNMSCDPASRRRIFMNIVPNKISRFYPPYGIIKRLFNLKPIQDERNTGTATHEIPGVVKRHQEQR